MSAQDTPPIPSAHSTDNTAFSLLFVQNCVSYAALTFHLCEWLRHLSFEMRHVWRMPVLSVAKWQYLFSQHTGTAVLIVHAIFSSRMSTPYAVSKQKCQFWNGFHMISAQCLLFSLQMTLLHRLLALYNRKPTFIAFSTLLIMAEYASLAVWGYGLISDIEVVGGFCEMGHKVVFISLVDISVHGVIWFLTLAKYKRIEVPVLNLVIRDGSRTFAFMLIPYIGLLVNANAHHYNIKVNQMYINQILFPLFITVFATANCHMIRNMEIAKAATSAAKNDDDSSIVLDSIPDLDGTTGPLDQWIIPQYLRRSRQQTAASRVV